MGRPVSVLDPRYPETMSEAGDVVTDSNLEPEELDRALRTQFRFYEDYPLASALHHLLDEAKAHLSGWGSTTSLSEYRR